MILGYLKYEGKDIKKTQEHWGWTQNGVSTWNKDYLIHKQPQSNL